MKAKMATKEQRCVTILYDTCVNKVRNVRDLENNRSFDATG